MIRIDSTSSRMASVLVETTGDEYLTVMAPVMMAFQYLFSARYKAQTDDSAAQPLPSVLLL